MNDHDARAVAELEAAFPAYQIWLVTTWSGNQRGIVFCARRWDESGNVLNAGTAGELRQQIADAEARHNQRQA